MHCGEGSLICNLVGPHTHTLLQAKQHLTGGTVMASSSHMRTKQLWESALSSFCLNSLVY